MAKAKNLIGKKFGKLTVISTNGDKKRNRLIYKCLCECGNEKEVSADLLQAGRTKSCGCLLKETYNKIENREYALKKRLYSQLIRRSRKLNLEYNITLEDFIELIDSSCYYCGEKHSNQIYDTTSYGKRKYIISDTILFFNGIDRLDSNKGYIKNNVVPCCKHCNFAKNTMGLEEFKKYIIKLYNNFIKNEN